MALLSLWSCGRLCVVPPAPGVCLFSTVGCLRTGPVLLCEITNLWSLVSGLWLHRSCTCGCVVAVSSLRSRVHSPSLCRPLVPCPLPSRTHLAPTYSRHEWLPRRVTASCLGASFGAVEGLVLPHALAAHKRTDHPKRAKSTSGHIALARDSGSAPVVGCGLHWSALLAWGVAWCERRVRTQVLW